MAVPHDTNHRAGSGRGIIFVSANSVAFPKFQNAQVLVECQVLEAYLREYRNYEQNDWIELKSLYAFRVCGAPANLYCKVSAYPRYASYPYAAASSYTLLPMPLRPNPPRNSR
jgi:hypothetical protein